MNAVQALSLRKPEVRNIGGLSTTNSEVGSRFNKKSNIKEILVRNFFRKYPLDGSITDGEQLKIERQVATEMDNFVNSTQQINSKNLNEFEFRLATEVKLNKRVLEASNKSNLNGGGRIPNTSGA